MEILRLPGYTEQEKVEIAKRFLIAKELEANGVTAKDVEFADDSLKAIIQKYTREAVVVNLQREIASICRKVARSVVKGKGHNKVRIKPENLSDYIGIPKYRTNRVEEKHEVGFVTGLAWTEVGGEILSTEATLMSGRGKLTLTG